MHRGRVLAAILLDPALSRAELPAAGWRPRAAILLTLGSDCLSLSLSLLREEEEAVSIPYLLARWSPAHGRAGLVSPAGRQGRCNFAAVILL